MLKMLLSTVLKFSSCVQTFIVPPHTNIQNLHYSEAFPSKHTRVFLLAYALVAFNTLELSLLNVEMSFPSRIQCKLSSRAVLNFPFHIHLSIFWSFPSRIRIANFPSSGAFPPEHTMEFSLPHTNCKLYEFLELSLSNILDFPSQIHIAFEKFRALFHFHN